KVQPEDVEEAYAEEKAIREIGVLQKDGKLVALIVPAGKHGEQNIEQAVREAIERVSRRLPPYQRVSEYALTRDAIQRTRLGKIRRYLLSERYEKAKKGEEGSRERLTAPMHTEAAITHIETIRDLLREVSEASEAESESQPLDRPEEILTDKQKRWLEPPGLVMRLAARILFFTNRTIMRTLFQVEARGLDRLP